MKRIILGLIAVSSVFFASAQEVDFDAVEEVEFVEVVEEQIIVNWEVTFKEAVAKAKQEHKPILIYFTGSDWCGPCIQLDEKLFHTEKFVAFSEDNMVLYMANFPRNTDLVSDENKRVNKQLSARYNQESFPTMIVVDENGNVLGRKNGSYLIDYYYPFFEEMVRYSK